MSFRTKFRRSRHRRKAWNEAYAFRKAGKFAEAAQVSERLAAETLKYNELIYADDCYDAFKDWLKAEDPDSALRNGRRTARSPLEPLHDLRVLVENCVGLF